MNIFIRKEVEANSYSCLRKHLWKSTLEVCLKKYLAAGETNKNHIKQFVKTYSESASLARNKETLRFQEEIFQ